MSEPPASLIDSHCHLADPAFDGDREAVVQRARQQGVAQIVAVGGGGPIEASERSAELAARYPFVAATAGIHPHDASSYDEKTEQRIEQLLGSDGVVAVGETGLDYYYEHSPRKVQQEALARQLALARRHSMPVVLHCRRAHQDLRELLEREAGGPLCGVVHCFTGDYKQARSYLDKGLLVSFTGILTFRNADALREVAAKLPLDRLMVETDAPYLAPVPHRRERNEPAWVGHVARVLAELHRVPLADVAAVTTCNARTLFFPAGREEPEK